MKDKTQIAACRHGGWVSVRLGNLTRSQRKALKMLMFDEPHVIGERTWNSLIKRGLVTEERSLTCDGAEYARMLR